MHKGVIKVLHDESNGMNNGIDKRYEYRLYVKYRYGANFENSRFGISRRLVRDEMRDV